MTTALTRRNSDARLGDGNGPTAISAMPQLAQVHGKNFAVIFVEEDGTDDSQWTVLTGVAQCRDGRLFVDRGSETPEFPVPEDTLDRISPVPPDLQEILNPGKYYTVLFVGPLPENADPKEFIDTGLRLPTTKSGEERPNTEF